MFVQCLLSGPKPSPDSHPASPGAPRSTKTAPGKHPHPQPGGVRVFKDIILLSPMYNKPLFPIPARTWSIAGMYNGSSACSQPPLALPVASQRVQGRQNHLQLRQIWPVIFAVAPTGTGRPPSPASSHSHWWYRSALVPAPDRSTQDTLVQGRLERSPMFILLPADPAPAPADHH